MRPNPLPPANPNALRDHLANERTFLAWIRTAIAIIALGFVVAKFGLFLRESYGAQVHLSTVRFGAIVGVLLVLLGMLSAGLASRRFLQVRGNIDAGLVRFDPTLDLVLAGIVGLISVLLAAYIIVSS